MPDRKKQASSLRFARSTAPLLSLSSGGRQFEQEILLMLTRDRNAQVQENLQSAEIGAQELKSRLCAAFGVQDDRNQTVVEAEFVNEVIQKTQD